MAVNMFLATGTRGSKTNYERQQSTKRPPERGRLDELCGGNAIHGAKVIACAERRCRPPSSRWVGASMLFHAAKQHVPHRPAAPRRRSAPAASLEPMATCALPYSPACSCWFVSRVEPSLHALRHRARRSIRSSPECRGVRADVRGQKKVVALRHVYFHDRAMRWMSAENIPDDHAYTTDTDMLDWPNFA